MRRCVILLVAIAALTCVSTASATNYIVLYKGDSTSPKAAKTIAQAGGTLVHAYDAIGVAIVSSSNTSFASDLAASDAAVENVHATTGFGVRLADAQAAAADPGDLPNAPSTDADTFSSLQWDMAQISAPAAHAVTGGSPAVLVGDIDTGLDYLHPDLRANVDAANSASCIGGAPIPGAPAANDDNGHGTHTAGTIAAASNGVGIVGVAPNVKVAGIKAGNAAGYFFPEAVICAFMWAGSHGFEVTNNSYFADPYYFNCKNDPQQRAIWEAESRAIKYAMKNGVTVVAAMGNFSDDLAHPTQDTQSPDFPPGAAQPRPVNNGCVVVPTEVPGVISVTATGVRRLKSYYSSYGMGVTDVAAPGGDRILQQTADTGLGRVLSTYPASRPCAIGRQEPGDATYPIATYCYLQGTSMASPHVAGLAALVISRYGDSSKKELMQPNRVEQIIETTADPHACPTAAELALYAPFPSVNNGAPQTCAGGTEFNGWYGHGIVNALAAVTN